MEIYHLKFCEIFGITNDSSSMMDESMAESGTNATIRCKGPAFFGEEISLYCMDGVWEGLEELLERGGHVCEKDENLGCFRNISIDEFGDGVKLWYSDGLGENETYADEGVEAMISCKGPAYKKSEWSGNGKFRCMIDSEGSYYWFNIHNQFFGNNTEFCELDESLGCPVTNLSSVLGKGVVPRFDGCDCAEDSNDTIAGLGFNLTFDCWGPVYIKKHGGGFITCMIDEFGFYFWWGLDMLMHDGDFCELDTSVGCSRMSVDECDLGPGAQILYEDGAANDTMVVPWRKRRLISCNEPLFEPVHAGEEIFAECEVDDSGNFFWSMSGNDTYTVGENFCRPVADKIMGEFPPSGPD